MLSFGYIAVSADDDFEKFTDLTKMYYLAFSSSAESSILNNQKSNKDFVTELGRLIHNPFSEIQEINKTIVKHYLSLLPDIPDKASNYCIQKRFNKSTIAIIWKHLGKSRNKSKNAFKAISKVYFTFYGCI